MVAEYFSSAISLPVYVVFFLAFAKNRGAQGSSCWMNDDEQSLSGSLLQAMSFRRRPYGLAINASSAMALAAQSLTKVVHQPAPRAHTSPSPQLTPLIQKAKEWIEKQRLEKELDEQKRLLELDLFGATSQNGTQNISRPLKEKNAKLGLFAESHRRAKVKAEVIKEPPPSIPPSLLSLPPAHPFPFSLPSLLSSFLHFPPVSQGLNVASDDLPQRTVGPPTAQQIPQEPSRRPFWIELVAPLVFFFILWAGAWCFFCILACWNGTLKLQFGAD